MDIRVDSLVVSTVRAVSSIKLKVNTLEIVKVDVRS